jgi:REP element-mobilizing transposase RayT
VVLRALENTRQRYRLRVYGLVLMPEPVHLLLSEPERSTLARVLQSFKSASARMARNIPEQAAAEQTPFWPARYYDRYMRGCAEFSEKLQYLPRNPVARGWCASPEQWPWSSFPHYWSGAEVGVQIESKWTARAKCGEAG